MAETPAQIVNSGAISPDSGTYINLATGRKVTLVKGKRSPPIKGGGTWTQIHDSNPDDRSSRKHAATVITTPEPSPPSPFATAKEAIKDTVRGVVNRFGGEG